MRRHSSFKNIARLADRLSTGLARIEDGAFDAIILDLTLPDSQGLATFEAVHRVAPRLPAVVLTGLDDEGLALKAVAQGAQDYLVKGAVKPAAILRVLRFAVECGKALNQVLGGAAQPAPDQINATELRRRLVASDFGVQFLFAPQEARQWRDPDPDPVAALLRAAAEMATFVVVDLAAIPGSAHRVCARMCDPFLLVMEREPIGVAAGKRLMNLLEFWELEKSTLAAVLVTKNPMSAYMSPDQASAELGVSVAGVIPPAAEALETAYRLGAPLLIAEPESMPADSLQLLAQRLTAPVFAMV